MDLQPSAPYASASSFPSPTPSQMNTDPLISFEKIHHEYCHREGPALSASNNAFPKFQFANFNSSSKTGSIGIDLTPELLSTSTPASWGSATTAAQERIRPSTGPYFSPNKIAYRNPGATTGGGDCSPPALPSPPISASSSTLQGFLQRCGLGNGATLDLKHNKNQQPDVPLRSATPACIAQKIRNLDEILRNWDHYSMSKRFAITTKEVMEPLSKKTGQYLQQPKRMVQDMSNQQFMMSNTDQSSGTLGGSVIPDGITHVNKSISRMEFKTQMEKLTDIIDDRWPCERRVEKDDRVESQTVVNGPSSYIIEPSSTRNFQELPQTEPTQINATNASAASTNVLEEMLRNIIGLERRLARQDRSKQTKHKGFLAKGKLWVHRPAGKKLAAMLQKQFKRHATSINQRLDKTDLAITSLRRRQETLLPYFIEENYHENKKEIKVKNSNGGTGSLSGSRDINSTTSEKDFARFRSPVVVEKYMKACEALSRSMESIQNQLCTLQRDSHQMGQSLEKIEKQSNEQNMEIELCWTAINHLCIDNETFREELQVYRPGLPRKESSPMDQPLQ